jgi:uncharacterized protein (DUF2384 family)
MLRGMSQLCSRCNAPLPLGPIGTIATCAYCGTDTRLVDLDAALKTGLIKLATPEQRAEHHRRLAEEKAERAAKEANGPRLANRIIIVVSVVFAVAFLLIARAIWKTL